MNGVNCNIHYTIPCCRLSEDLYQTAKVAKVLLLLNAGKGKEFKGKSLKDVQITEDEILDANTTTKVETNQVDEDDNNTLDNYEIHTQHVKTNDKITGRTKWLKHEKDVVLTHFKEHIQARKAPKKQECLDLISTHPDLFSLDDWVRIKTLVFNTYRIK